MAKTRRAGRVAPAALLKALILSILVSNPARAGETLVAVAANFTEAAQEIGAAFEVATGHEATFSFGPTGQLYAQITQDAPFDVFLAADQVRPEKAEAEGLAVPGSRFTYATGRLVLWSADPDLVGTDGRAVLADGGFEHLAIANPVTAPYGAAAVAVMEALGVHDALSSRLVQGKSISQTHQFVATGNAELGFVALSQVIGDDGGSRWMVPADLYPPIHQDAVLLQSGADNAAARAFLDFMQGPEATRIIESYGYATGG